MKPFVRITTVFGSFEAEIFKGMIEANEIPVLLKSESAGKASGLGVGPLAEVDVLVPKELEPEARELLAEYRGHSSDS